MKFTLTNWCVMGMFMYAFNLHAQQCNGIPEFAYNNETQLTSEGFISSEVITCIQQGQQVQLLVPFQTYSTILNGQSIDSLSSLTINSVGNLPCGLCWGLNKSTKSYQPGEMGVLVIQGLTSSAIGQYPLNISITVALKSGGNLSSTISAIAGANGNVILRVIRPEDDVPAVNYTAQGNVSSPCN